RYNPFACATEKPADCASASHFSCTTSGSAACAVPNRPKQTAAIAATKILLHIGSPSPARRFQIKPDKQQNRPGAHQPDAPDPREIRPARQIERHEHDRKTGQAQRVHAEQKILGKHRPRLRELSLRAKRSNLVPIVPSTQRDCFVAALLAMTS